MKNIRLSLLLTGIILAGCSSYTFAQLGTNLSVDLRALSMGNAVTADPPGVNAIHFNPAALTKIDGLQTEQQIIVANFDIQREFSVPAGYNVFGYSDDPIVCNDGPEVSSDLCTDFKGIGIYTIPELCVKLKSMLFNLTSLAWTSVLSSAITAL